MVGWVKSLKNSGSKLMDSLAILYIYVDKSRLNGQN